MAFASARSSRLMKRESSGGRMQREPSLRTPRRVTIDEMQRQESPMDRRWHLSGYKDAGPTDF
eukprot:253156-Amphidinium_carterae.1